MSVASLTKFTVPISGAGSQGTLMPKLKYRFRAILENFGVTTPRSEITKNVMNITRPTVSFENQEIHVYNSKINVLGKHTWDPVTINLRDDVNGEMTRRVGEQMQKQFDFFEQMSSVSGVDYKFTCKYEVLDGGNGATAPVVLETWELYGCYILNVNYNEMDYTASDPASISLSIQFDNALNTPIETGIGAQIGRTVGTIATG
jgi:hypothetical protein